MIWVAGVDGCRGGWVVALAGFAPGNQRPRALRFIAVKRFDEVLRLPEKPRVTAVDMPIGLLARARPGGRECDREARHLLGPRRASVFTPPARPALAARRYREAIRRNGAGLSLQSFCIRGKIAEVDRAMRSSLQRRVVEAHPEMAFRRLAGHPMPHGKKSAAGRRERRRWLRNYYGALWPQACTMPALPKGVRASLDDWLDACALAITAARVTRGDGRRLPVHVRERDARGLRMEIWY